MLSMRLSYWPLSRRAARNENWPDALAAQSRVGLRTLAVRWARWIHGPLPPTRRNTLGSRNIPPYSRVGLVAPDFQLHITRPRNPAARRGRWVFLESEQQSAYPRSSPHRIASFCSVSRLGKAADSGSGDFIILSPSKLFAKRGRRFPRSAADLNRDAVQFRFLEVLNPTYKPGDPSVGGQRTLSGKTVQVPGGLRPHPQGVVGDSQPSAARSRNMRFLSVEPPLFLDEGHPMGQVGQLAGGDSPNFSVVAAARFSFRSS